MQLRPRLKVAMPQNELGRALGVCDWRVRYPYDGSVYVLTSSYA
jgi:hypothetical protein